MLNDYLLFFEKPCPGDVPHLMEAGRRLLGEKRLRHVRGVYEAALGFAKLFKLSADDTRRLELAVWFHDFMKGLDIEGQMALARRLNIDLPEEAQRAPSVIHAVIGAWLIPNVFGLDEPSVCEAVFHHTTGHPKLGMVGKLLFLADYCEGGRGFDSSHITALLPEDLNGALLITIREKIIQVLNKSGYLHSASLSFYHSLLSAPQ